MNRGALNHDIFIDAASLRVGPRAVRTQDEIVWERSATNEEPNAVIAYGLYIRLESGKYDLRLENT